MSTRGRETLLLSVLALAGLVFGLEQEASRLCGGYSEAKSLQSEDVQLGLVLRAFAAKDVAESLLPGISLKDLYPVSYSTQIVSGTNYKIQFKRNAIVDKMEESFEIVLYKHWSSQAAWVLTSVRYRRSFYHPDLTEFETTIRTRTPVYLPELTTKPIDVLPAQEPTPVPPAEAHSSTSDSLTVDNAFDQAANHMDVSSEGKPSLQSAAVIPRRQGAALPAKVPM